MTTKTRLRLEKMAAGWYRWNRYSIHSVVIGPRKEWRVTWAGEFVNQCGSLQLAREAVLIHEDKIRRGEL